MQTVGNFVKTVKLYGNVVLTNEDEQVAMNTRGILLGMALAISALASGCAPVIHAGLPDPKLTERDKKMMALAEPDEWRIPDIRNQVEYQTSESPGTIIVDTRSRHLYFVLPNQEAIEYRIATGVEAYAWSGRATVGQMKEWPTWMPTASIMERWPEFRAYIAHGPLEGRWDNPLGARSISFRAITTRSTASTAPTNRRKSARRSPPAASACATWTRSTFTTASTSARRCWCCSRLNVREFAGLSGTAAHRNS